MLFALYISNSNERRLASQCYFYFDVELALRKDKIFRAIFHYYARRSSIEVQLEREPLSARITSMSPPRHYHQPHISSASTAMNATAMLFP